MGNNNNQDNSMFSGEIDPDIAELMGITVNDTTKQPDYADLFKEKPVKGSAEDDFGLTKTGFPVISKYEEAPKPFFSNKNYYKTALDNEGEEATRFHSCLGKFLNAADPKERTVHRGKLIAAYWNLLARIGMQINSDLPMPKKLMLRFGAVLPTLLSKEHQALISRILFNNEWHEPVHYVDEWLSKVATGRINPSATDETKPVKQKEEHKILNKVDQVQSQRDFQSGIIQRKTEELMATERLLASSVKLLSSHSQRPGYEPLLSRYTPEQQKVLLECQNYIRMLSSIDKDLVREWSKMEELQDNMINLQGKAEDIGAVQSVDSSVLQTEFNTIRQMNKMCVGRQGNHMPVLMKNYFRANIREICTRENVIDQMTQIEQLDPGLFQRTFKRETSRIVPHVILIPCYGERGVCWEPFERFNRATSRGRIAIPIFPKDIKTAVVTALADLRWQVAKEKAQHYWMEEGLTGRYYQWFTERKMRGDVKEYFINDYLLWITRESEGTQKLDREVRGIFWRHMPFPDELRETLKNRGFVYNELFKKDINRSLSDGY